MGFDLTFRYDSRLAGFCLWAIVCWPLAKSISYQNSTFTVGREGGLCFEQCVSEVLLFQQEGPFESASADESGPEDQPSVPSVVDVEDLGTIVSRVRKEKVLWTWGMWTWILQLAKLCHSVVVWSPSELILDSFISLPPALIVLYLLAIFTWALWKIFSFWPCENEIIG